MTEMTSLFRLLLLSIQRCSIVVIVVMLLLFSTIPFTSSMRSANTLLSPTMPVSSPTPCSKMPTQQYDALYALYMSTNGKGWSKKCNNWVFSSTNPDYNAPCNGWYGVSCNSQCNVTELDLPSCHLTGTIPSQLGNLTSMIYVGLFSNSLTGTIPSQLGLLTNMTYLWLYNNSLTGTIPSQLGSLAKMTYLILYSNSLTGTIPSQLGSITNMTQLYLYSNSLTGTIPSQLGSMTNMMSLALCDNSLTGIIPTQLGYMTSMQSFVFFSNSLTGPIPSELGYMNSLSQLILYSNSLSSSVPSELGRLKTLTYFYLNDNGMTGTIPSQIFSITTLTNLDLADNYFTGEIPLGIRNLTKLNYLYLSNNRLTGIIPSVLESLTQLVSLSLSNNSFTGSIPSFLATLTELKYLYLDSNSLTGTIPSVLCSLGNLALLYLQNISLVGPVPSNMLSMKNLLYIDLSFNDLSADTGSLMAPVTASTSQLSYINMAFTQLAGSLPSALFQLPQLSTLILSHACITGSIPDNICQAKNLTSLIMDGAGIGLHCPPSKTVFHGSIPACVFAIPALNTLHLAGNELTGPLGDLAVNSSIFDINIDNNRLTGTIPLSIQSHKFVNFSMAFNKITGTLISSFQAPSTRLGMRVNRLSGKIPQTLISAPSSIILDILQGNLFGCPSASNDVNSKSILCGSSSLNYNFISWLVLAIVIMALSIVALRKGAWSPSLIQIQEHLTMWWKFTVVPTSVALDHTKNTIDTLERASSLSIALVVWFILVVMMTLISLKQSGSYIFQVQYLYSTTAAYISGYAPVIAIWIYLTITALIVVVFGVGVTPITTALHSKNISRISTDDRNAQYSYFTRFIQRVAFETLLEVAMLILATGVNLGYVAIVYLVKPNNLTGVQFSFAVIKSMFSALVSFLTKRLPKSSKQQHALLMSVIVNIISPGIATLFLSPFCLYYKFNPNRISPVYQYPVITSACSVIFVGIFACIPTQELSTEVITITPVWNYSYQCSSSFLASYLPNFIFFYILNGIVYPLVKLFLMTTGSMVSIRRYLGSKVRSIYLVTDRSNSDTIDELELGPRIITGITDSKSTSLEASSSSSSPSSSSLSSSSLSPHETATQSSTLSTSKSNSNDSDMYRIEASSIMTSICFDITLLLTFGLASPLLAVLISWSMVINTIIWRLALGRYIHIVSEAIGQSSCYHLLESALHDEWHCLSRSWWIMSILIGLFWCLFVNDMIGDQHPTAGVVVAVMMLIWCTVVFISMQRLIVVVKTANSSNGSVCGGDDDNDDGDDERRTDRVESLLLLTHDIVWKHVLRLDNVRSSGSGNGNGSGSDGGDAGKTINETISPLGSLSTTTTDTTNTKMT